ncbi:TPA_asm: hypothetical protein GD612_08635 [Listeria monocytogenes]|nr:hypothetical protein [Listeria monocytogenes]HAA1165001.1 hypothetical protein [Listeria monocytogenes]HAA1170839.1 hypothetical protein [Listeria monocytogenes]HAA1180991.1 hypothetical protein [Listeria monocytogenes]HAA1183309.1 hypothetical protein [Listeria monocytogenes]
MKIFKATIYYGDLNEVLDNKSDFENYLERLLERVDGITRLEDLDESREFEWHDDIDINYTDAEKEAYEKYFDKKATK